MKAQAYNIIAENMIIDQVRTKREARELIAEFKRLAKIDGITPSPYTIEPVR